jgi:hypothetical protein
MGYRPDHLPKPAVRVITASRQLQDIDKIVWREIQQLDRGPEGCYAAPDRMASRVGCCRETVERSRRRLLKYGLLEKSPRKDRYTDSWFPALPPQCIPPKNPRDERIFELAERLDEHIRTVDSGGISAANGLTNSEPVLASGETPDASETWRQSEGPPHKPGGTSAASYKEIISTEKFPEETSVLELRAENRGATARETSTENANHGGSLANRFPTFLDAVDDFPEALDEEDDNLPF